MLFNRNTFTLGLFSLVSLVSYGQKIKYKDLFVLLNAKQYDQAEPFLKRYLKENQDNPNAFLFMGYIYEEKALANDVLRETEKQNVNTDSAVLFFDRAFKEIDERELKKNDEYYQSYSRRDLRTGKFGLKLSDIQFDLEKKMEALKNRQKRVLMLKEKFIQTQNIYGNCELLFKNIASQYKDKKEFYLRADDKLMADLRRLGRKYDSCFISFNDYKATLEGLGKTGHKQELDVQAIGDFKHDGYAKVDFFEDEIKVWDYKRWALSSLEVAETEILPMRVSLVKLDAELNNLREKIRKDSVSVVNELPAFLDKVKKLGLTKYDPKPLPADVYHLKIQELRYGSELVQTRNLRDTANLLLKLDMYKTQIALLRNMDSTATLLTQRDMDYDFENYKDFVKDAYGSMNVLKSLIKSTGDFAVTEKANKERQISATTNSLNWVIDRADSIPASITAKSTKYFPLFVRENEFTFGLRVKDTLSAYFYTIPTSRKAAVKTVHRVDTAIFNKANLLKIKGISTTEGDKNVFFAVMYSEEKREEKIPACVYKVTQHDGLNWSKAFNFEGAPTEATYNKGKDELSIKIATTGGSKVIVIQRDGNVVLEN